MNSQPSIRLTRISKVPNSPIAESDVDMENTLTLLAKHSGITAAEARAQLLQGQPLETPFARYTLQAEKMTA